VPSTAVLQTVTVKIQITGGLKALNMNFILPWTCVFKSSTHPLMYISCGKHPQKHKSTTYRACTKSRYRPPLFLYVCDWVVC